MCRLFHVAYAMDIIAGSIRNELHAIRKIRNVYAHSSEPMSLDNDEFTEQFNKLKGFDPKIEAPKRHMFLSNRGRQIHEQLWIGKHNKEMVKALMLHKPKKKK